jgi:NAD(P)-dependent dehydrogenase (short-subunit alcohol dehydrogenase family)
MDKQEKQPGHEHLMEDKPESKAIGYRAAGKLKGKRAVITGGDSGIGRSVAVMFAKEGADSAIIYFNEHEDARKTKELVEQEGQQCLTIAGDVGQSAFCNDAVSQVVRQWQGIDILVNNAAEQHPIEQLEDLTDQQLLRTFQTNIFSYFYMTRAALPHMKAGGRIINTSSITAYRGSDSLLDYSSTKGAIVSFTRSLAIFLAKREILVNGVAPGPIWTPLIPASFSEEKIETFGESVLLGRAGQPDEVAPSYVFLAGEDASYMTGQMLHPNGGWIINT